MTYEFDGHTEKEAVDKAIKELGLEQDCFDVEILEAQKGGLFRKGYVKVRIHIDDGGMSPDEPGQRRGAHRQNDRGGRRRGGYHEASFHRDEEGGGGGGGMSYQKSETPLSPENEIEEALVSFSAQMLKLIGLEDAAAAIIYREHHKIVIGLEAADSSLLIGRKGRTLDSIQFIVNNYAAKLGHANLRVILDCEHYRLRREDSLARLAYKAADKVRHTRQSILLEPMNPFDRRIIHTAVGDMGDVGTESEGEGSFKQVRVFYRGGGGKRR